LPGFPDFLSPGSDFLSLPQKPRRKELAFHSQLASVWYGRQWECEGMFSRVDINASSHKDQLLLSLKWVESLLCVK
jgi:hypothetical protein